MTRRTSIEAHRKIESEGLLSKRRFQVYDVLFHGGPMTATQIADKLPFNKSSSVGANVHARLGELRAYGVVMECGEVECPVTKNTVISWDVTDKLPKRPKPIVKVKCDQCDGRGHFNSVEEALEAADSIIVDKDAEINDLEKSCGEMAIELGHGETGLRVKCEKLEAEIAGLKINYEKMYDQKQSDELWFVKKIDQLLAATKIAEMALVKAGLFCTWLSVDSLKYPRTDAGIAGKHEGHDIDKALQSIRSMREWKKL